MTDAKSGLCLCPCDINPGNFKKLQGGLMVALDFHATCFMPRSFVNVAMEKSHEAFAQAVSGQLAISVSDDVKPMLAVSNYLVQFGRQPVGKHGFCPYFPTLTDFGTTE